MEAVILLIGLGLYTAILLIFGLHVTPEMRDRKRYAAGIALVNAQRYTEGLAYFKQAAHTRPQSALAWAFRAECHWGLGEAYQALAACQRALNIDYSMRDCYLLMGIILHELGDYLDAYTQLSQAIWHYRERHPLAFRYRGQCALALGRYAEAQRDLQRALSLGDEDAQRYLATLPSDLLMG